MKISKMENTKELSVIIVNYKSEHFLEQCLNSLYLAISGKISFEVIIVNNYSPETLEKIQKSFPEIRVIINAKNGGFGQGNNIGTREALGKYLLFLNPDTEIISGNFNEIREEFERNDEIGALSGQLMTEENNIQEWSVGQRITFWDLVKNNLGFPSGRKVWESRGKKEVAWVAGTFFFIRRKLFLDLGGFDENIFMYFEDVDLCERIKKVGKKILYFPEIRILHKYGGSYAEEGKRWQKKNYYDSMEYYFKKHRPKIEAWSVRIIRKIFFI